MRVATVVVVVAVLAGVAAAQTGNEFNSLCFVEAQNKITDGDLGYCHGFIDGVTNTIVGFQQTVMCPGDHCVPQDASGGPLLERHICVPKGVTTDQLFLITKRYFVNNPEHLEWPARVLIQNALVAAFPCK